MIYCIFLSKAFSPQYWDYIFGIFITYSRYSNLYNVLYPDLFDLDSYLMFVNQAHIRRALHVGNQEFAPPPAVYFNMAKDFMNSAMHFVEYLLDRGMRIMFYRWDLFVITSKSSGYILI